MRRAVVSLVFFSALAGTAFAVPPGSVNAIPVFQGATRDLAAEQDFMQFASGMARVYRTSAPVEKVFNFYKGKLDAKPEAAAEMSGGSGPAARGPSIQARGALLLESAGQRRHRLGLRRRVVRRERGRVFSRRPAARRHAHRDESDRRDAPGAGPAVPGRRQEMAGLAAAAEDPRAGPLARRDSDPRHLGLPGRDRRRRPAGERHRLSRRQWHGDSQARSP